MSFLGFLTDEEIREIEEELKTLKQEKLIQDQERLAQREMQFVSERDAKLLAALHPIPRVMLRKTLVQAGAQGLRVGLHTGYRSIEQQDKEYEEGRELKDGVWVVVNKRLVVTNRIGGLSFHNYAIAGDIVFKDKSGEWTWDYKSYPWDELGDIGKGFGLVWGGNFKTIDDKPHFEYTVGLRNAQEALSLYRQGGMDAVWAKII